MAAEVEVKECWDSIRMRLGYANIIVHKIIIPVFSLNEWMKDDSSAATQIIVKINIMK